jgi:hydroxyethylthiazole kinase-like uncharacterized protein yjeF
MTELLTAAQMRAIEQAAIASGEVTGLELMERAGAGVVAAVLEEWPELALTAHRAVVLCGPGNNGGDGFVVARLLKQRGWEVEVFLYGDPERMPADARVNYEKWVGMGEVTPMTYRGIKHGLFADLYVDAIFGIGLTRPAEGDLADVIRYLAGSGSDDFRSKLVSIDIPSGLDADSGLVLGCPKPHSGNGLAPYARLTVTFHTGKPGHFLEFGPEFCGRVVVRDIGLSRKHDKILMVPKPRPPKFGGEPVAEATYWIERRQDLGLFGKAKWKTAGFFAQMWVLDPRTLDKGEEPRRHKFSHGHALILSGPATRTGAARLAARGALRIGAGLVTVAAPPEAMAEHAARLDAIMLREVSDAEGLAEMLADDRITALCLGPGLGLDDRAAGLVTAALASRAEARPTQDEAAAPNTVGRASARLRRPTVLDADALTILSRHPDLFAALHDRCVLTPHAGEFARLFPDMAEKLAAPATNGPAYSKVDATREAAARAGCVVLYKGPDTVIADPSGRASISSAAYDRAAPWLATAGSGDVLAGFIAGLLARGFTPIQAAESAAWLHVECARSFGPGLIAEDLPEQLPKVFRALGL